MIENNQVDFEDWLDDVRVKMYEEMQRLGQEEYNRQMDARIQKVIDEYGLTMVDSIPSTHISDELKQRMQKSSELASEAI